jgi:hypothetical protein
VGPKSKGRGLPLGQACHDMLGDPVGSGTEMVGDRAHRGSDHTDVFKQMWRLFPEVDQRPFVLLGRTTVFQALAEGRWKQSHQPGFGALDGLVMQVPVVVCVIGLRFLAAAVD